MYAMTSEAEATTMLMIAIVVGSMGIIKTILFYQSRHPNLIGRIHDLFVYRYPKGDW
jgi:hypothetical protein